MNVQARVGKVFATPKAGAASPRDAGAFSPAVAIWMVAAAVVSAIAFVLLLAFGPKPRSGAYVLSRSAVGYAALVKLLEAEGWPVRMSSDLDLARAAPTGVLVLTPDVGRQLTALPRRPLGHIALVVTPKWISTPDPSHRGWVTSFGAYDPALLVASVLEPFTSVKWSSGGAQVPAALKGVAPMGGDRSPFLVRRTTTSSPVLHDADGFFTPGTTIRLGPIRTFQAFSRLPPGWEQGLVDEQGRTVIAFDRRRRLFVLSDPDLLNTQGLNTLDAAMAATRILDELRSGDEPLVFDLTLSGVGGDARRESYSVLRLVLTPPFLSATLCGVAAALLMGLHAAIRFGPQRRAGRTFALGKRALADNSAALIHMARRDAAMAPRYATLSRNMALESLQIGRSDDAGAINARLDRVAQTRGVGARFAELERDAARVADGTGLMAAAQALYRWRLEMTRGR